MSDMPSAVTGPICPLCRQPLFGRTIWTKATGNCHDTCVEEALLEEIGARWATDTAAES